MIKTINYSKVESITYKFTKHEILNALAVANKINLNKAASYEFDLYEEGYDPDSGEKLHDEYGELIIKFEEETE